MWLTAHQSRENGFTMVEILVVLLILAVLTAIAVPTYLAQRQAAYEAVLKSDLVHVGEQVTAEHDYDENSFPEPFPVHSSADPLPPDVKPPFSTVEGRKADSTNAG